MRPSSRASVPSAGQPLCPVRVNFTLWHKRAPQSPSLLLPLIQRVAGPFGDQGTNTNSVIIKYETSNSEDSMDTTVSIRY